MVQVRFEGWRQDDVPRVLYADAGKRILVASLSEEAQEALDVSDETVEIEETGQSWTKASLDGWLPKEKLTANTDKLWHYANALYSVNCSACHAEPHVNEFGANKWMGQFKSMVASTNLEKEQARLVQSYLQLHARDMEGSGTAH